MNPQDLLEQTEKTIDHGELLGQHERLKILRKELSQFHDSRDHHQRDLNVLIAKNERLAPKVEAIKEKQAHCDKVNLLNQKKHWLLYHQAVEKKTEVEEDLKLAKDTIAKKEKENAMALAELKKIEDNTKSQQDACLVTVRSL